MNNKRRLRKALGGFLAVLLFLVFSSYDNAAYANAEGLTQTEGTVSDELKHDHTSESCYTTKWIPCGAAWFSYWEPYYSAICYACYNAYSEEYSNGVQLKKIHAGFYTDEKKGVHAGEYYTTLDCGRSSYGKISLLKENHDEKVYLRAIVDKADDNLLDCKISWNGNDYESLDGESMYEINHNGRYCAALQWTDGYTGAVHTKELYFNDTSFLINLNFIVDENTVITIPISYGESLPSIDIPQKTGYIFDGFYSGDKLYYDANGVSQSIETYYEETDISISPMWQPKKYTIAVDAEHMITVTYGEAYDAIDVPDNAGALFAGYEYNGELIFDKNGNPTGIWKWDVAENTVLTPSYVTPQNDVINESNNSVHTLDYTLNNSNDINHQVIRKQIDDLIIEDDNVVSDNVYELDENIKTTFDINENISKNNYNHAKANNENEAINHDLTEMKHDFYESQYQNVNPITRLYEIEENIENVELEDTKDEPDYSHNKPVPKRKAKSEVEVITEVIEYSLITLSVLGLTFLVLGYYLLIFGFIKIYTYEYDNKKKYLGRTLIYKAGDIYKTNMGEKFINQSRTGRFEMVLEPKFIKKNANRNIVIRKGSRTITDVIKPIIFIKE